MKSNKTGKIGIIITIIILVALVIFTNVNNVASSFMNTGVSKIFLPAQKVVVFAKNKLTGKSSESNDIKKLQEDNSNLREENEKLKEQVRELEVVKAENNRLNDSVNLANKYQEYQTVSADIIEKSFNNYDKLIIINAGTDQDVHENMAVVSNDGLVGHVVSVTNNTAKVHTIQDTASTVSAVMGSTNDNILIKGTLNNGENLLRATAIPVQATILAGDHIFTSGLGGIYPRGIYIGTVKDVVNTKNDTDRYANVEPATNFNNVKTVLVIKQY